MSFEKPYTKNIIKLSTTKKIIVRDRMLWVISLTLLLSINLENFNLLKCKFN
jgi:hypothetical protein